MFRESEKIMYGGKLSKREKIGESEVILEEVSDRAMRIIVNSPLGKDVKLIHKSKDKELRLYPVMPIHTPKPITSYLIYRFKEPLVINPGERMIVTVETLLEIGIGVYSISARQLEDYIMFIPPYYMKYGLYGIPEDGYIGRMNWTPVYFDDILNINNPEWKALTRIVIHNYSDNVVNVSKLLVNTVHLNVYYDDYDRVFTNDIEVAIMSSSKGHVMVSKKVPLPGLNSTVKPLRLDGKLFEPLLAFEGLYKEDRKTIMKYGFMKDPVIIGR